LRSCQILSRQICKAFVAWILPNPAVRNLAAIEGGVSMDEILTAGEVAELLQIHPRTVYKLVKQGSIPGRKFGGGWRFSRTDILAMVSPTGQPPAPPQLHTEER
jgi:excisionase family DNA binding protein